MEAQQDGSIRVQNPTKFVMSWTRLGLTEERLIPFKAMVNVADADDRPGAFHLNSMSSLTIRYRASHRGFHTEAIRPYLSFQPSPLMRLKLSDGHPGQTWLGKTVLLICDMNAPTAVHSSDWLGLLNS
jgi:hypothetical protein